MMKKGQTATEYLIILAVVIIIALIVVGVMGGIPGMGGGAKSKTSSAYWSTAEVAISSATMSPTGASSVTLRNSQTESIIVNTVTINNNVSTTVSRTLTPGQQEAFVFTGLACSAGSSYSYPVVISYTKGGSSYSFNGGGQALEGTCASS